MLMFKDYILAVTEAKGRADGEYQLIGAMIKVWAQCSIYPIGKTSRSKKALEMNPFDVQNSDKEIVGCN